MNKKTRKTVIYIAIAAIAVIGYFMIPKDNTPVVLQEIGPTERVYGNKDAKVTVIEYADFQCPACAAYHPIVEMLKKEFANDVRFVFRHFPLSMHLNAIPAAVAVEAAGEQGKYDEMADMLFKKQSEWSNAKDVNALFTTYAAELGLDTTKFTTDIANETFKDRIKESYASGLKAKVNSTPSFFIQGEYFKNPVASNAKDESEAVNMVLDAFRTKLQEEIGKTK